MPLPESPNSNVEQYLSKISGQTSAVPEAPNSRVEQYLEYIAQNGTVSKEEIAEQVSEWLEENIHEDPTVVIDASLSVSGAAADAKATGDEITDLKADLNQQSASLQKSFDVMTASVVAELPFMWEYGNINASGEDAWGKESPTPRLYYARTNAYNPSAAVAVTVRLLITGGSVQVVKYNSSTGEFIERNMILSNAGTVTVSMVPSVRYRLFIVLPNTYVIDLNAMHQYVTISAESIYVKTAELEEQKSSLFPASRTASMTLTNGNGLITSQGAISTNSSYSHTLAAIKLYAGDYIKTANNAWIYQAVIYDCEPTIPGTIPSDIETVNSNHYLVTETCFIAFNLTASAYDGVLDLDINTSNDSRMQAIIPNQNVLFDKVLELENDAHSGTKIITQQETILSVQKEVVSTEIETVTSGRNAAEFGVLPSNSGSVNTQNLQAMLDNGGTIIIDTPGVYLFSSGLQIGSNTSLLFGNQVYCKRADDDTKSFLINKGAFTQEYNDNIVIDGLYLICDGHYGSWQGTIHGLRGALSFYYVKNLVLNNIRCDDVAGHTYFIHLAKWENVIINNPHIAGNKDAIHVSTGNRLHISNGWFQTNDDPIGLNAMDYVDGCPTLGWIKNVVVENCVDASLKLTGYFARILSGAWLDWTSGNQYRHSDTVVNSSGNVYRMIKDPSVIELMTSTYEPTHTTYTDSTYPDGIKWRYIGNGYVYSAGHENIVFRDIYLKVKRTAAFFIASNNDSYCRAFYPGCSPQRESNIRLESIHCIGDITNLVRIQTPVDYISIKSSKIIAENIFYFEKRGDFMFNSSNKDTYALLANNLVEAKSDASTVGILYNSAQSRGIKLNCYGNYKNGTYSSTVTSGTTVINNDLV